MKSASLGLPLLCYTRGNIPGTTLEGASHGFCVQAQAFPPMIRALGLKAEHTHIRTPEPVDGLLLSSDKEELVGLERRGVGDTVTVEVLPLGKQVEQLFLLLIIVLELVDHDVTVLALEVCTQGEVLFQYLHSKGGDITEGEYAGLSLFSLVCLNIFTDEADHTGQPVLVQHY